MWETWVQSLGREGFLEKEMATHSSIFAWRIPWTEEPGGLQSTGLQRVGYDWATSLSLYIYNMLYESRLIRSQDPWGGERGLGPSKRRKGMKFFSTLLYLSHIRCFFLKLHELLWQQSLRLNFFKPRLMITQQNNSSCMTICFSLNSVLMIIQQQCIWTFFLLLNKNLLTNLVILRGMGWEWVW